MPTDQRDDDVPFQLGRLESGGERKMEEASLPFDEDDIASAVPMRHVASYPPHGNRGDDVSSLQHTNMEGKDAQYCARQRPEGAVSEEDGRYYDEERYYEDEAEHARALQRRNMLIVVMLVLFLGLVVAIATGVGLAVKDNPVDADEAEEADVPSAGTGTDDEYDGVGGGVDSDDAYATSVPSSFPSREGPCYPVEVGIIFDEYSGETGWSLVKGRYDPEYPEEGRIVWKSKYYKPSEYSKRADTFRKCFTRGEYNFVFTDKEGDGICCNHGEGLYVLSSEGNTIAVGGKMLSEEEVASFALPYVAPDPVDEDGDGLDDRLGWIMPYDSSNMTEGADCENFRLSIVTDEYGLETTWELFEGTDKSGTLIANGGPYGSEYNHVVDYCLASPEDYALYVYDWDRRGLCCESGEGSFRVSSGDVVIVQSDGRFGEVNVTRFSLPADRPANVADEERGSSAPTVTPASRAPSVLKLWSTLVPNAKKTAYPTESPATASPTNPPAKPSASPTTPPTNSPTTESPTKSPTTSPTTSPTASPTKLELTPFPTLPTLLTSGLDEETIDKITSAMDAAEENKGKEDDKGGKEDDKGGKEDDKDKDKDKEQTR